MAILQIVAVGILSAVLALTVKRQSPDMALMISIAASVLMFLMILPMLAETVGILQRIGGMLDGGMPYIAVAVKVIGVAYMAELGSSVCTDAGESAVAARIDMAGRVMLLVLAAPVLMDLVNIILGLVP